MKKPLLAVIILGLVLANFVAIAGASPDLTEAGKRYIAENFGIGGCFVHSGLTWTAVAVDDATIDEEGGTYNIVARLVTTSVYKEIQLKTPRTGTYTYAMLKAANEGKDITLPEAKSEIAEHDGYPEGEDQYCIGGVPKAIKEYIAKNYGDGNCVTEAGCDELGLVSPQFKP